MKILKIENGKGAFSLDGEKWIPIDEIERGSLMQLLDVVLKESATADEFKVESITNQAHQIIYKSIYEKLMTLMENKTKFKDESDRTYLHAIEKYQEPIENK